MDRRTLIAGLAGAAATLGASQLRAAPSCKLITQDITGPYYLPDRQFRSDIREELPGVPLHLEFEVVETFGCAPLPGALVSVWHANAEGLYSGVHNTVIDEEFRKVGAGVDLRDATFLRGFQQTDAQGRVRFHTIFPGWYHPRPTHLHVKVYPPDFGEVATTQLYFLPADCDRAYSVQPYAARGPNPNRSGPGNESQTDRSDAADLWVRLEDSSAGYAARHRLGVMFYGERFGPLADFYRQG